MPPNSNCSLWMGDLESYMDEMFITSAFAAMGEMVTKVKLMKHKTQVGNVGYCFVEFETPAHADNALKRLNGLPVPGTNPIRRFKLNYAIYGKDQNTSSEVSLYVGDLSPEVTDYMLLSFFQSRYPSVKAAKVVCDATGKSKRFGFVRFYQEAEQKRALFEMQHAVGLGGRPIKVNAAIQKSQSKNMMDANSQYYQQYQQYQQYLQSYYQTNAYGQQPLTVDQYYQQHYGTSNQGTLEHDENGPDDPSFEIDVAETNRLFMDNETRFYYELEAAKWSPLESHTTTLPTQNVLT
eukprot:gene4650-5258_t